MFKPSPTDVLHPLVSSFREYTIVLCMLLFPVEHHEGAMPNNNNKAARCRRLDQPEPNWDSGVMIHTDRPLSSFLPPAALPDPVRTT